MPESEMSEAPLEGNSVFIIPIEGLIDAALDAATLGKTEELKALLKGLSISIEEEMGLQALVTLGKLPRVPTTTTMRSSVGRIRCSDYGCTRA